MSALSALSALGGVLDEAERAAVMAFEVNLKPWSRLGELLRGKLNKGIRSSGKRVKRTDSPLRMPYGLSCPST